MLSKRFPTLALVASAMVLLAGNSAHAQEYFFGYYYPNSHRFNTDELETSGSLGLNYYDYGPSAPAWQGPWVKDAVSKREPSPATIRMYVPDPQAKVWFDGTLTKSTGTVRTFNTPPLDPGTAYHYLVKISYVQDGREVSQERTLAVLPGHTAVFHFPRSLGQKTTAAAR